MAINYYIEKIKQKRKSTSFRDFLKEIASFSTFSLQKNNGLISKFPQTDRLKGVIDSSSFESIRDDLINNGIDYDFSKSFFENYKKLFLNLDLFNLVDYGGNENCGFCDVVLNSKDCYLSSTVINNCENILYSFSVKDNSKNVFNSFSVYQNSQNIYMSTGILESYNIFYSKFINNCNNCFFSSNLIGCSECIFCDNLENSSYFIENKKYEKEEYFRHKKDILSKKQEFLSHYKKISNNGKNINSSNIDGISFFNSQNVENGYFGYNLKDGKNVILVGGINGAENIYDTFTGCAPIGSDFYGIMGANGSNLYCGMNITMSSNIFYSYFLENCSYCLGCIGLKNKSYCILNKQYEKSEWEMLASKVFERMESDGTLGDFFPGELNPFYFNDTMAGILGDFTKEEVEKEGYMWRDEEIKVDIPEGSDVVYTSPPARSSLPPHLRGTEEDLLLLSDYQGYDSDGNGKINPEILKKVIKDEKGNYYRIVKMEYDFLMKHSLPLPEIHWMDRMKLNFGV